MADNYLGKKMEDLESGRLAKGRKAGLKTKSAAGVKAAGKAKNSLDNLLLKNRSCRGYDSSYKVTLKELEQIINVNRLIPSARNQQVLRFKPLVGEQAAEFTKYIKLGGALPELNLPFPGTEPNAYIIICSIAKPNRWTDVDLGISAQSMLLKAVDMGLNGICIGAFNKERATEIVNNSQKQGQKPKKEASAQSGYASAEALDGYEPLMVLAIGKSIEKFQLLPIDESENHNYFRENNIHYIPKVKKLIIE